MTNAKHIIVVGAGVGGLATALRLSASGARVTLFDAASGPGGKMRTVQSEAGPVDAGPTVLTMRWVFDDLFEALGEKLDEHVTLTCAETLARHFWADGTRLDLSASPEESRQNVHAVFGATAARQFTAFSKRAKRLFDAFDQPMMQAARPSTMALAGIVLRDPRILRAMAPHQTLAGLLRGAFSEPKLRQLFGRYATYVGGSPYASPALLSLIWHAEGTGVWAVDGGMNNLAQAMQKLAESRGVCVQFDCPVEAVDRSDGRFFVKANGEIHPADAVVFNGDPRALVRGLLGQDVSGAVPVSAVEPRSLSANVMAFAAKSDGVPLSHHNVFFGDDQRAEFDPLASGHDPIDPTLYVCAQDRGGGAVPSVVERFEIIMNAPPCAETDSRNEESAKTCQTHILTRLEKMGLTFSPTPGASNLTQPAEFHQLFPASQGSLYGRSPHGMTAGLKRPTARTAITGLYLAGGGAHPGAGVPMATLSGKHAAEAICTDLGLTSTCPKTAMPGGTLTGSAKMENALSLSSRS